MSDIFLSYASADRERAREIADALTARGWSVWWDRTIPPGKEFDQVIEEALDSAACVVVLWSRASTASSWVKTEAADAMRRKILVPALIDDTKIPLEFRRLQAADLSDWEAQSGHDQFEHLCRSIEANLNGRGEPIVPPPLPRPRPPRPERAAAPPPPVHAPAPPPRASHAKAIVLVSVGAILVLALGGFVVAEYSKRVALEEQIEQARLDGAARAADVAQRKAADDQAARDVEDRRRAQEVRQTRTTTEDQAPPPAGENREPQRPAVRTYDFEWNDASLRYSGTLTVRRNDAVLQFTAFDYPTGTALGQFTFPAELPEGSSYTISGLVPVAADSNTPYPHQHSVTLYFDVDDGVPRLVENCQTPQNCFPARGAAAH